MNFLEHIRERGYMAGYNGRTRDCPYPENSDNADAWEAGFDEGQRASNAEWAASERKSREALP